MHSQSWFRKLLVFSLVAVFALPIGARSGDEEPKGKKAKIEAIKGLNEELKGLEERLEAERKKDEPSEAAITNLEAAIQEREDKIRNYGGDLRSGNRKFNKVVDKEERIAKYKKENEGYVEELKKGGKTPDEVADIQEKIRVNQEEITRLENSVKNKEKGYKRRMGSDMPVRCKAPKARDVETNTCRECTKAEVVNPNTNECMPKVCDEKTEILDPKEGCLDKCDEKTEERVSNLKCMKLCGAEEKRDEKTFACVSTRKKATREQMRALDECYTPVENEPIAKRMYVHFGLGKDEVPEGSNLGKTDKEKNENDLVAIFSQNLSDVRTDLTVQNFDKIGKLEAVGYASYVKGTKKPADLATARGKSANTKFTAALGMPIDEGKVIGNLMGLQSNAAPAPKVEGGPKWSPGEYKELSKRKVTPKLLRETAEKIVAKKGEYADFTPVRVDDAGDVKKNVEATMKKLEACCDTNQATLMFQPYQFTEIKIYPVKFDETLAACVRKADEVANATTKPGTGESKECRSRMDPNCMSIDKAKESNDVRGIHGNGGGNGAKIGN